MSVFYTSKKGLFSKKQTLTEIMQQTIPQDTIEVNQGSLTVDETQQVKTGDITIQGTPGKKRPVLAVEDRMAAFLVDSRTSGTLTFRHVAIQLGNSSYALRCLSKNVNIVFDDVQIYHTVKTNTPYVSVLLENGGNSQVTINNSLIDGFRCEVNQININNSNLGDWFFAGYGESRIYASQLSFNSVALQNTLVSGENDMSQGQIINSAFGGNVKFQDMQISASNISLMQLPAVNHRSKLAYTDGDSTSLIVGENCSMTIKKFTQVDPTDNPIQSGYQLPKWRTFGIGGGSLTLSDGYLKDGTLKNIAKAGDLTLENVTDDSSWAVDKEIKLSNRNSKSELFAAQSKLAGPKSDGTGPDKESKNALQKIDSMIGLETVKAFVKQVIGQAQINAERKRRGIANSSAQRSLNMVFEGNPGTGKTAVAQLVGQALYEAGVLKSTTFVTTTQSDLVSNHVGETAMKTREVFRSALDGVLFVDEAYQLAPPKSGGNSFNDEAVTELVKDMDAYSDRIVVIMAGYTQDMNDFLRRGNQGLKSRMQNIIEFPDYTPYQMKQIERLFLKDNNARFSGPEVIKELDAGMDKLIGEFARSGATGNGRLVRNYVQKVTEMRDGRLAMQDTSQLSDIQLMIIEPTDVKRAVQTLTEQAELTR